MVYSPVWVALGVVLITVSMYDFYVTTVTVNGSGPLSRRLLRNLWRGCLWIHRKKPSPGLLDAAGPAMLLILIGFWFGVGWLGWFLVFCGSESAVVNATTNLSANIYERLYYAGYTVTTIGYGNFIAPSPGWQVASVIAGLNGLFLVTLAITYSVPVISAAVEKRRLALQIYALGTHTTEILDSGRGNADYSILANQLTSINSNIAALSEKHLAYPILHYFRDDDARVSLPLNLARLDDAIAIVLIAFPDLPIETASQLRISQRLIDRFLHVVSGVLSGVVSGSFAGKEDGTPPAPNLTRSNLIREMEVSPEEIQSKLKGDSRRKLLLAYILDNGWSWEDVHKGGSDKS